MNWKSGIKRLAVVAALFWAVGWSYYAYLGNMYIKIYDEEQDWLEKTYKDCFSDQTCLKMHSSLQQQSNEANEMIVKSVHYGLGIPIALIVFFPFGWFVFRGFRPRSDQQGAGE